jgi:DNA polymerase III subunit delta'
MALDGLRGHREILARLQGELATRPSHAYLFSVPAGVGKALVAEGLAHGLLCERSPGVGFCCTPDRCPVRAATTPRCACCAACAQVAARVHPDFSYVARPVGKTDVLIEQVRELIAQLWMRPTRAPARVAIIDDAESLNLPAQNALLKTLEEPPGHAIIFVVTSSERALLDTVRSRLRPVRFGALAAGDVEAIVAARAGVDAARARAIARLARGSAGRAMALVEGDEPPVKELVEALKGLKKLDFAAAAAIAQELFSSRDLAAANFELIARLLEEILCFKLLGQEFTTPAPEAAALMTELGDRLDAARIAEFAGAAVKAAAAVEAMANPRLQAESWWMTAARAARSD